MWVRDQLVKQRNNVQTRTTFAKTDLTFSRRRLLQLLAAFTLIALPLSALAWQTNITAVGNDLPSSDKAPTTINEPGNGDHMNSSTTINTSGNSHASSNQASSSISQHLSVNSDGQGSQSSTTVQINGKSVKIPADGQLHKTYTSADGTSQVDISVDGTNGSSATNNSSVDIQVDSDNVTDSP